MQKFTFIVDHHDPKSDNRVVYRINGKSAPSGYYALIDDDDGEGNCPVLGPFATEAEATRAGRADVRARNAALGARSVATKERVPAKRNRPKGARRGPTASRRNAQKH